MKEVDSFHLLKIKLKIFQKDLFVRLNKIADVLAIIVLGKKQNLIQFVYNMKGLDNVYFIKSLFQVEYLIMNVPQVLCIKNLDMIDNLGSIDEITMKKIVISDSRINIKANKLYYLFIAKHPGLKDDKVDDFKLYHISEFEIKDSKLVLYLGSSTVLRTIPPLERDIVYKKLADFGVQEIQPGCLIYQVM